MQATVGCSLKCVGRHNTYFIPQHLHGWLSKRTIDYLAYHETDCNNDTWQGWFVSQMNEYCLEGVISTGTLRLLTPESGKKQTYLFQWVISAVASLLIEHISRGVLHQQLWLQHFYVSYRNYREKKLMPPCFCNITGVEGYQRTNKEAGGVTWSVSA